jgi:hypothetical protein
MLPGGLIRALGCYLVLIGKNMRYLILALIAIFMLNIEGFAAELSGTVKSASGKPLAQVFIF